MNYDNLKMVNDFLSGIKEYPNCPEEIIARKRQAIRAIEMFLRKKNKVTLDYMEQCIDLYRSSVAAFKMMQSEQPQQVSLRARIAEVFKW
jgi:Flp pilus assembly secretin CpaC